MTELGIAELKKRDVCRNIYEELGATKFEKNTYDNS